MTNQGKRPDQTKFSEDVVFYGILGMLFIIMINFIIKLLSNP